MDLRLYLNIIRLCWLSNEKNIERRLLSLMRQAYLRFKPDTRSLPIMIEVTRNLNYSNVNEYIDNFLFESS